MIPAIELSVEFGSYHDVHLLGYFIDHTDAVFLKKLVEFRRSRDHRGQSIIANINVKLELEQKAAISYDEAINLADGAFGRPHHCPCACEQDYARDMQDAFERYLIPCDVPKQYFPMDEALAEIKRIGGVSVLAHPTSISEDRSVLASIIRDLAKLGLKGLEAYNNMCNAEDSSFLLRLASDLQLSVTGGSDFHGIEAGIELGAGRGHLAIPYSLAEELKRSQEKINV